MKKILFILSLFVSFVSFGQVYQQMPQYGYQTNRMNFDSTLQIPTICGVPTLKTTYNVKRAAIAFDSCNNRYYYYNPKTTIWSYIVSIDSLKRSTDSIFAKKNGTWIFQYKDSTGGSTPSLQQVTDVGATTTNTITATNLYSVTTEYNKPELNGINVNTYPYYTTDGGVIPQQSYSLLPITGNQEPIIYNGGNASGYNKITPNYYESMSGNTGQVVQIIPTYTYSDNHYLPISDNQTDTLATLSDVAAKVNIADTATMLAPYLQKIDTTNKWVTSVTKVNDSTIRVVKYNTTTDIVITPSATVTAATRLVTTVYNNSGTTITKGSVVYINGRHSSNLPTIALAQANSEQTSYATFALVQDDILNNNSGTVIQAGNITNLNLPTATYTDGDIVYLSATTAGGITNNKSSVLAPNHIVKLGTVTRAHPTFGGIEIKIENGWQLDELSDVQIPAVPNDSTLLQFSRVDSLWHAVSVNNAIGTKYLKPSDTATMLTSYLRSNIATATYLAKSDTASLSSRIDLRVRYSDTVTMLTPYLRKVDTASLSSRINLKLNISDTATMLTPYLRSNIAAATYQGKLTLTTTGTSGAATLVGNTLNIPQYSGGSSYTFSTGLTNTAGTVTNNLSTGVAGGQSVIGGTAASETLTLSSTSNATKGKILFGTSAYDEVNNRLGIGTASPSYSLDIQKSINGFDGIFVKNSSNGSNARNGFSLNNDINAFAEFLLHSSTYSVTALRNSAILQTKNDLNFLTNADITSGGTNKIAFFTGGYNNSATMTITGGNTGNILIGTTTNAGYKLDVNGTVRLNGTTLINTSVNSNNVIFKVAGDAEFTQGISATTYPIVTSGQVNIGNQSISSGTYRTTNAGSNIIPKLKIQNDALSTSGKLFASWDETNQLSFSAFNSGSIGISRASIGVVNLGNTAGSESGDLAFYTQSGGTAMNEKMRITSGGGITLNYTNTATGTTGNQTINKPSGTVNIAAAGTTITVTNSLVTTSSLVFATIRTNDATAVIKNVVPASGSFTINLNAAATAETSIGFFVINQ